MSDRQKVYCEDWGCPAHASCARHFGRSREYWSMTQGGYRLEKFPRRAHWDACLSYVFDKPRPWLLAVGFGGRPPRPSEASR